MKVSFILISSWTYLSSLEMISNKTSCRVRSRDPRLETRSSSVTSLQEVAAKILLPLLFDICEYGVPERRDAAEVPSACFCRYGELVRVEVALTLVLLVVVATSVLEDEAAVERDTRGSLP